MQVFLSWSGAQSRAVAETLKSWIVKVIQAAEPWTSADIEKGARWSLELQQKLEQSKVGIICLTQDNLDAPWILFEAGALSKTKDALVCTFLLGLAPSDVQQPLGQFQHSTFEKADIRKLLRDINRQLSTTGEKSLPEKLLDEVFETNWSDLDVKLKAILGKAPPTRATERSEREILEEILEILRNQERRQVVADRGVRRNALSYLLSHSAEVDAIDRLKAAEFARLGLGGLVESLSGAEKAALQEVANNSSEQKSL